MGERLADPGDGSRWSDPAWVRATIYRPVTVFVLFVALLVVGLVTFPRIPTALLPTGLSSGHCGIWIPIRDGTAKEVMEQVAKPTEDLLRTLPGLVGVTSSSGPSRCLLRLEFDPSYDMDFVIADVRDRIERARISWPDSADDYYIWRQRDSDVPVMICSLGVETTDEDVDLDWIFDEIIRRRIERVPGVARVEIWGLIEKRVEIQLDRAKVESHGIDVRRLIERLTRQNAAVSAGRVREGDREYLVRLDGRFRDFDEILDFPIDASFRIRDIADVGYTASVRDRLSRVNGRRSRVLVVSKESSENAVEVSRSVREEIEGLEAELGRTLRGVSGVTALTWLDQGELITSSIDSLSQSGLYGGTCAMLVLFVFFRRVGLTLLVTLSIPFSLLITIIWIYFSGNSFNLLSLMGLSLAIGMLVDNSIVVVENILRQRERGLGRRRAAIEAIREVGLAVGLATLTTVFVLLPILFLGDPRFTAMTQALGLPLCISVLASLVVALGFIPQGAIVLDRKQGPPSGTASADAAMEARRPFWLTRVATSTVRWGLAHRFEAILVAVLLLSSTSIAFHGLAKSDFQMDGPRGVSMRLELPRNFSLADADEVFGDVERHIRARSAELDLGVHAVTSWFDRTSGEVQVFFESGRRMAEQEFFAAVRPFPRLPGVKYRFGFEDFAQDMGTQRMRVFIEGSDYDALRESEEILRRALADRERFPRLTDVSSWSEEQRAEVRVEVDRAQARLYGVDTQLVSTMVSWALRGAPLPDFVRDDREVPLWIAYDDWQKESVAELDSILVPRADGTPVRLDTVARYRFAEGSGEIHRRDGKLTAGLSVGVEGMLDPGSRARVEARLRAVPLPKGCRISMTPPEAGFQSDMENTMIAMGLAMALVFFVMGVLFESWLLPLSVLFCVPFAFFGSVWLLFVTRVAFDAVGMIGMLMLIGIVVNNAIVLVDCINRLRADGEPRPRAISRAVELRFRPIWMTALTTIFGLLPLSLTRPEGDSVDYRALAVVIMGGLATSTFFTLFVVPILYTVLDDVRRVARVVVGRRSRGASAPRSAATR